MNECSPRFGEYKPGTYSHAEAFLLQGHAFISKSPTSRSECTMNIFYIIGVVVVIVLVAGFLGLHV
jgi:hypothetical protein